MNNLFSRMRPSGIDPNDPAHVRIPDPSEEFDLSQGCYPAPTYQGAKVPEPEADIPRAAIQPLPYDHADVRAHLHMAWESLMTYMHRLPNEGPRMCEMMDDALAHHCSLNETKTHEGHEALLRVFIRANSLTLDQITKLKAPERQAYTVATFAWRDVKESDAVCTAREALMLNDAWELQQQRKR